LKAEIRKGSFYTLERKLFFMKDLFSQTDSMTVINRIESLQPYNQPQWGKMNVSQMLAHCQVPFSYYFGERKQRRGLMAILFGTMAKKKMLHNGAFTKNLPTAKDFIVTDERDFEKEKRQLIEMIKRFTSTADPHIVQQHPFFGKMSGNEWAVLAYKHLDHHLRQFGV
jgi:hypothetical protein